MDLLDALTTTPLTKRALASKMGCTTREVEIEVQEARLEGAPILSGPDGYWLTTDPQEVAACASRLRSRAVNQLVTSRALRKTARRLEKPLVFDWRGL